MNVRLRMICILTGMALAAVNAYGKDVPKQVPLTKDILTSWIWKEASPDNWCTRKFIFNNDHTGRSESCGWSMYNEFIYHLRKDTLVTEYYKTIVRDSAARSVKYQSLEWVYADSALIMVNIFHWDVNGAATKIELTKP